MPEPILNRMNVYSVPRPTTDQSYSIAMRLYRQIIAEHDWGFPSDPAPDVLEKLAGVPPRDMRKRLMDAFGNAKLAGRDQLTVADLDNKRMPRERNKIGF